MITILIIVSIALFVALVLSVGLNWFLIFELNSLTEYYANEDAGYIAAPDASARRAAEDLHVVLPRDCTYHWTDGGKPIPGATGPDMSAREGGAR